MQHLQSRSFPIPDEERVTEFLALSFKFFMNSPNGGLFQDYGSLGNVNKGGKTP